MSWRVSLREPANADLREARDWYEARRVGLGDEFLLAIAEALRSLEESPERHPLYYRGLRRLLLKRFPYKLFFRIDGDQVIVFRVLHGARDHRRKLT